MTSGTAPGTESPYSSLSAVIFGPRYANVAAQPASAHHRATRNRTGMSSEYAFNAGPHIDQVETVVQEGTVDDQHARRVCACFRKDHGQIVRWLEVRTGSLALARDIANEAFVAVLESKSQIVDLTPYVY